MLYSIMFKGAVMQIEKALINHRLRVRKVRASFTFQLFIISQQFTREICCFLKKQPNFLSKQFLLSFLFIYKTLWVNNLKTRTTTNAKISVFIICVKAIIYLLSYNLHDCTFKESDTQHNVKIGGNIIAINRSAATLHLC